jgi:hypothetical protein
MSYKDNKHTILTAQHYDKKISVEFDHADTDLDEIMDAVETLVIGMGFHKDSLTNWIMEKASQIQDERIENGDLMFSIEDIDEAIAEHNSIEELDNDGFNDYGMRTHNYD